MAGVVRLYFLVYSAGQISSYHVFCGSSCEGFFLCMLGSVSLWGLSTIMFEMDVAGAVTITMIERRSSLLAWIESNFGHG